MIQHFQRNEALVIFNRDRTEIIGTGTFYCYAGLDVEVLTADGRIVTVSSARVESAGDE